MVKKLLKLNIKIKILITAVVILTMCIAGKAIGVIASTNLQSMEEPISSVTINGHTYTKENPLIILEIVPAKGAGEIGYMVGNDSGAVRWSDILALPDGSVKKEVVRKWALAVGGLCGNTNVLLQDSSGKTYDVNAISSNYNKYTPVLRGFDTRNLFAWKTFDSIDMNDKIEVKTVPAGSVTVSDVESADVVYVSSGGHLGNATMDLYNSMAAASKGTALASKYPVVSVNISQSTNNFKNNKIDLSTQVTWKIFERQLFYGMSVMFDKQAISSGNLSDYNIGKLGTLIAGIDGDTFIEEYAMNYDSASGIWSGTRGSINTKTLEIFCSKTTDFYGNKRDPSKALTWKDTIFIYDHPYNNNGQKFPYYSPTNWSQFLNKNTFLYNGDNTIGNAFVNGTSNNSYKEGTDFELADKLYGDGKGNVPNSKLVRYILGDFPKEFKRKLQVLEIQPAGSYEYTGFEGAKKIFNYFGFRTEELTESNYRDYVEVRGVSSSGFNGLNEELYQVYDLIAVGTKSNIFATKYNDITINGQIYTTIGDVIRLNVSGNGAITDPLKYNAGAARLSGNDLTDNSYRQLCQYSDAGYPLLLDFGVYYGSEQISQTSFMYGIKNLKSNNNTICQTRAGATISDTFTYVERPEVNVASPVNITYNSNELMNYDKMITNPEHIPFIGTISGPSGHTYRIDIYIDKNGDGIYVSTADNDNELYLSQGGISGTFNVTASMSSNIRGYLAWKAVVTDESDANVKGETRGAFVVENREPKTVKVLQIVPDDSSEITLDLTSSLFKQYFDSSVTALTGMKMEVTKKTISQWTSMYSGKNKYTAGDYNKNNMLKDYSMVVVGYSDNYDDTSLNNANGALDNLKDYIERGNAVLFTHDTMSYSSYSDGKQSTKLSDGTNGNFSKQTVGTSGKAWNSEFTWKFRNIIGMDRYGVTVNDSAEKNNPVSSTENKAYSEINQLQGYSNGFLIKYAGNITSSKFSQTGYALFNNLGTDLKAQRNTKTISKLNTGQVTEYPYAINDTIDVAETHGQYFQLDLEGKSDVDEKVIVWYTLGNAYASSSGDYYGQLGQDAVNNYYIYSKGNVTFSSAGNKAVTGESEIKLFVNTIVKAISAGNAVPEISVDNATPMDSSHYTMYFRDGSNVEDMTSLNIDFTAKDPDLSPVNGKFKSGLVYYDRNSNEMFDTDTDVVLLRYDDSASTTLWNGRKESFDLFGVAESKGILSEIKAKIADSSLMVGFEASDSLDAVGTTSLSFVKRQLFNLN